MRNTVLQYIRERALLCAGDRVAVAVSGGADSVALLRVLLELRAELGLVLVVAHFNHGLRGEASQADEAFVAALAKGHNLQFFAGRGDVGGHSVSFRLSLEAAARQLRYQWFSRITQDQRLTAIATAHTQDDQAETVLLKLLRGTGTRGLAGVYPVLALAGSEDSSGGTSVVRPLLGVTRDEVEAYLSALIQPWRDDESNLDRRFTRNRVRHDLLPLLEREFNPKIRKLLSDAAEVARGEEEFWQEQVNGEFAARIVSSGAPGDEDATEEVTLNVQGLAALPVALQRRLLKRFAEDQQVALDFDHVEQLRRCALGESPRAELPGGLIARHLRGLLGMCRPAPPLEKSQYQYRLSVPGEVEVAELGLLVRALMVSVEFALENASASLLDANLLGGELVVRNWTPGDRFWPAHSRAEEKLKRLFAEKHIPTEQRASWPVAMKGDEIVWVRGFPVAHAYRWQGEGQAVDIEVRASGTAS